MKKKKHYLFQNETKQYIYIFNLNPPPFYLFKEQKKTHKLYYIHLLKKKKNTMLSLIN